MLYLAIVSIAVTLGLFVISPAAGFLAAELSKPWIDATFDQPSVFGLPPTQVISATVPMFVLGYLVIAARGDRALARMPFHGMWVAWIAYAAVFSAAIAYNGNLLDGANTFFRHANGIVGFYAVQAWFRKESDTKVLITTLVVAGLFPMATGVYEGLTGYHWHEVSDGGQLRNVGMYHDAIAIRVYALQTLLALTLLTVLYLPRDWFMRSLVAAYAFACLYVIYNVLSKSGTLIVGGWAILWPLLRRTRHSAIALAGVAALAAVYLSGSASQTTFLIFNKELAALSGTGDVTHTFSGRWDIWQEWQEQWDAMSPWQHLFGSGHPATGLHNDYLMVLTHGGLIGFGLYVALMASIAVAVARNVIARPTVWNVTACLLIVMWMVDSIGLVPSAYSAYQWFVWGIVGLALRLDRDRLGVASTAGTDPTVVPRARFSIIP